MERNTAKTRKFQHSWKVGRPWLHYDIQVNRMSCSWCVKYKDRLVRENLVKLLTIATGNFIDGTCNFRKSTVVDHEQSKGHNRAVNLDSVSKNTVAQSVAGQALIKLKEKQRSSLRVMFRTAHALSKHNRPISDFNWLCELDEAKGLDVGTTYRNEQACAMFVDSIAAVELADVVESIKKCSFFSLSMDGSTDIASLEQETLFARMTTNGEITCKFLRIAEPESTRSEDLLSLVKSTIQEIGIETEMTKFVGFSCDGASNMLGRQNGMATLLQREYPLCMVTHCLAHRLELAYKDAIKQSVSKKYDKVNTLMVGLYYFYKKSSKQRKMLRRCFEAHAVKCRIPPRVGGTRWVGHMQRAIDTCLLTYPVLVDQLNSSSHTNPKAEGLVKLLTDHETVAFILLLKDLLKPLVTLSQWLQKPDATMSEIANLTDATIGVIQELKVKNGYQLQKLLDSEEGELFECKLKGNKPKMVYKDQFLNAVVDCITKRFTDINSPIVNSTSIGSLRQWPIELTEGFGEEAVQVLYGRFGVCLHRDLDEVLQDWQLFRTLMYKSYGKNICQQSWPNIHRAMAGMGVDSALKMVDLVRTLSPTSVLNETCFSQMKLIKTERRHRMGNTRLNNIMLIKLDGTDIANFNPDRAIDHWMVTPSGKGRHLSYPGNRKRKIEPEAEVVQSAASEPTEEAEMDIDSEINHVNAEVSTPETDSDNDSECDGSLSDEGYNSENEQDFVENNQMLEHFRLEL